MEQIVTSLISALSPSVSNDLLLVKNMYNVNSWIIPNSGEFLSSQPGMYLQLSDGTDQRQQGEFPYNLNNANRFIMPFIITSYGSRSTYIGPYCVCRGCGPFTGEAGISSGTVNFGTGVGRKTIYYDPSLNCESYHSLKLIFDTHTGSMRVYWDGVYKGQGTVSNPNKLRFGVIYTADFGDMYVTNIERALIETDHDATRW